MWLERFSGQSAQVSPSPTPNRSFSPAPRRSIQLGPRTLSRRPALGSRTSSLATSVFSNSSDSLPPGVGLPNGSSLKARFANASEDNSNPVDALEKILGPRNNGTPSLMNGTKVEDSKPDVLVNNIDFQGLSLDEFATDALMNRGTIAPTIGVDHVDDYEVQKDRLEELHKSIAACDEVLKSVETYLTSFRADLANVATEIEMLQNRSTALNNKLQNRKAVEKILSPEVEALTISPAVVRKIIEGAVDDAWVKALDDFEKRSKALHAKLKVSQEVKAALDLQPLIEDVSTKAVERIRDHVVAQIKALRSPNVNAQVIQQDSFLRYKGVFGFLAERQPELAEQISQAYVYTMRWYYLSHFTRYRTALEKLKIHTVDSNSTIAADAGANKSAKGPAVDAYAIGRRNDILRAPDEGAMSSFAAEQDRAIHFLETPFRAFNVALVDNVSAEYSFLTEFFSSQSHQIIDKKFHEIFQPTFDLGRMFTKQLIDTTLDALGILAGIRLNQHSAFELQRRKVAAGEGYVNGISMLLWPRFQIVVDAQADSIRKATASLSGKSAGTALSLTGSASNPQSTAPHPLTQRYANFLQGILALSSEAGDDEPIANSVARLKNDFEAFLRKLGKGIVEGRKRERFLYNNYSLVCTIIAETEGKLAGELKREYLEKREVFDIPS